MDRCHTREMSIAQDSCQQKALYEEVRKTEAAIQQNCTGTICLSTFWNFSSPDWTAMLSSSSMGWKCSTITRREDLQLR